MYSVSPEALFRSMTFVPSGISGGEPIHISFRSTLFRPQLVNDRVRNESYHNAGRVSRKNCACHGFDGTLSHGIALTLGQFLLGPDLPKGQVTFGEWLGVRHDISSSSKADQILALTTGAVLIGLPIERSGCFCRAGADVSSYGSRGNSELAGAPSF
jgi:hypothetical protein